MIKSQEYIGFRHKVCEIVTVGSDWYDFRDAKVPTQRAYCRNCRELTAKPVYAVYMNGKPAIAVQCTKCKEEYVLYESDYNMQYVGLNLRSGGKIEPTYGKKTWLESMDRRAVENRRNRKKKLTAELANLHGMSKEDYEREQQKQIKKAHQSLEEVKYDIREKERKEKAEERKELLRMGVLQYVKGVGLVDTRTNQIYKL